MEQVPAVILLEDGTVYNGHAAGKIGTTIGELCFNTGMTGYQEVFTDPSYYGQILVMTNAHIGNYGVAEMDTESKSIKIAGLVVKNYTNNHSRPLSDGPIQDYFEDEGLVGIGGVDTRAIVKKLRTEGAMNAIISSETTDLDTLKKKLAAAPKMEGLELASLVSTKEAYDYSEEGAHKIAALDFGIKENILRCFKERNCQVRVFPAKTSFEEMSKWGADGYFLSNGPGDPASMTYAVDTVKQILDKDKPVFGICLGHQLLALAAGIDTYKMHHGHRGINHPVIHLNNSKCEITSQNHGFAVNPDTLKKMADVASITHRNLNDKTVEGLKLNNKNAFSVQYHPESAPGPHDSRYLFDDFIEMMASNK
jgi:carbamoyl-phosphate synthase small subunit